MFVMLGLFSEVEDMEDADERLLDQLLALSSSASTWTSRHWLPSSRREKY